MRYYLLLLILIAFTLFHCSHSTEKERGNLSAVKSEVIDSVEFDYDRLFKLDSYLVTDSVDSLQLQVIDSDCVLLVYPNQDQIDQIIDEEGEEDFYIIADDSNWYQAQAIQMVDSVGIEKKIVLGQYVKLVSIKGTWIMDVRKRDLFKWNMIFFSTKKEPLVVDEVDLTTEKVREYFGN